MPRRYDKYIFFLNKRFSILIFTTEHKIMFINNINHRNAVQIFETFILGANQTLFYKQNNNNITNISISFRINKPNKYYDY